MIPLDIVTEEIKPGDWRIVLPPRFAPPMGKVLATSYNSKEEALLARKNLKLG
jgi:hypothetical protein